MHEILTAFLFRIKTYVMRKTNLYLYENVYGLAYDICMFIVQSVWSKCICKRVYLSLCLTSKMVDLFIMKFYVEGCWQIYFWFVLN